MLKGPGWKLFAKRIRIRMGTQSVHKTEPRSNLSDDQLSNSVQPVAELRFYLSPTGSVIKLLRHLPT